MEVRFDQALQKGIIAHNAGNIKVAAHIYRVILHGQPTHPQANHNLGLITFDTDNPEVALPLFEAAVENNPKIEQFWISYIVALAKEKQFKNAKRVLRKAKKAGCLLEKLNVAEVQQIKYDQAKQPLVGLLVPPEAHINTIITGFQNGKYGDAERLALLTIQQFPEHPVSWKVLGAIFGRSGRFSEALTANKKVIALTPKDAEVHNNLGNAFKELGRLEEAEESYRQAIALEPDFAVAHGNLGIILNELGKLEEAEEYYRQAIILKPDDAILHNNLGNTQQNLGKLEEAEENYRQAIVLKPDFAGAHRHLSLLKTFHHEDEHFVQMQKLCLDQTFNDEQRTHFSFALAKASEDLDQLDRSFKYYSEGNALRKKLLNYDISQDIEFFEQLIKTYPSIEKSSAKISKLISRPMPIFIIGMPRSGTTLVEQIISSHTEVIGAGELPYVAQFGDAIARGATKSSEEVLLDFRETYIKKIQNHSDGNRMVTDKMPLNFRYIGLLLAAFPDAKIVHVKRNSAAVCWGNYKQYFATKTLGYSYGLDDVVTYYALYQDLMRFWEKQFGNRIYNLDYESLTVNQGDETKKLIRYLGLEWENGCLAPQDNKRSVSTASNMQVRRKIYQGSSQKWRKFEPFLNDAFQPLDD